MKANTIFQSIQQGILICDRQGRIAYFNEAYGKFIGKHLAEVQGLPIKKLRPHSRAPEVLRSGVPLEGLLRKEQGQEYFVNIYPLRENGEINGTISIVTTIDLSRQQAESQNLTLKERVTRFERQEIETMLELYGHDVNGKRAVAEKLGISLSGLYEKLKPGPGDEQSQAD